MQTASAVARVLRVAELDDKRTRDNIKTARTISAKAIASHSVCLLLLEMADTTEAYLDLFSPEESQK